MPARVVAINRTTGGLKVTRARNIGHSTRDLAIYSQPSNNRRIRNLDRRIKKINNSQEQLYNVTRINITADATDPVPVHVNAGIGQGDAPYQRDGQVITATSFRFRGVLSSQGAQTRYSVARVIVFWCRSLLTGPPNVTGNTASGTTALLNSYEASVASPSPTFSWPYSLESIPDVFKPIYDRTFVLNPGAAAGTSGGSPISSSLATAVLVKINKKFNRKIKYDGTTGSINDFQGNSLWMTVISDNDTNPPILSGTSRFMYKDN